MSDGQELIERWFEGIVEIARYTVRIDCWAGQKAGLDRIEIRRGGRCDKSNQWTCRAKLHCQPPHPHLSTQATPASTYSLEGRVEEASVLLIDDTDRLQFRGLPAIC